ncbi:MAG: lamin tail domain-containing protein [Bacteroidetes bacterium]|nr:lamin tail domain-containing protein [Bacteroidota bacterium]MBU1484392.1 lamin tail domain-containing protein [Bacteroidota bacterium]MBU2268508.1 lamin tail domain-containing protein [Bacteroidota bacterium]MBU2374492.1 lamin tail domain-containing protein [Bacteroidota bacterium]
MRKFLLLLTLFISKIAFSQVLDNFSDGNFTQNPVWQADVSSNFVVINQQLRSNSTVANSGFYISTPNSKALNCTWEFDVNLQFATSGANYVDVYLISNSADLKSTNINGYFLRMGNTADEIALYKRSGTTGTSTKIIDGRDGSVGSSSNNPFKFKVTRESNGKFTVERDSTGTGNNFVTEGAVLDNTFTTTTSFGFFIQQSTASFHQKHFFDNIVIQDIVVDVDPPVLTTAGTTNGTAILLNFNEAVNPSDAAITSHYNITPGNIQPSSVTVSGNVVTLNMATQLSTGNYTATVNTIKDIKGNTSVTPQSKTFFYRKPYTAKLNDIVINEIFPDPSPQVDLPSVEFIEIYNRTTEDIGLVGFKYSDQTSTATFGNDSIKANSYIILCAKADTAEFKKYGKVIGLSPWPSLNNSNDVITLSDQNGNVISSVSYADTWYRDATKKAGGWSLERIDPFSNCLGATAWKASNDSSGGTPGKLNSVNISNYDALSLKVDSFSKQNDSTLLVVFSKSLDQNSLISGNFNLQPTSILKSINSDISQQKVTLTFSKFQPATTYQLQLGNMNDCSGKAITGNKNFSFKTAALRTDTAKLIISEIFADPSPEVGLPLIEFIEIYNAGKDTVDLKDYSISNGTSKGKFGTKKILPNEYVIVCPAADSLSYQSYGKIIAPSSFPTLTNTAGKVILKSHTERLIDSVAYADTWYRDATKKGGGWSLEKLDLFSICKDAIAWTSSKDISGGTPGKQNSVNIVNYDALIFKVDSFYKLTDSTLLISFSKSLDQSALITTNFTIQPSISLKSITSDISQQKITLTFSKFQPATNFQLQLGNINDCSGKAITGNKNFSFKTAALRPDTAKLIISEIFADPSPEVGLPLIEFVEIFNNSKDTVDLKDYSISNGTSKGKFGTKKILPNDYIIVCAVADTLAYQPFGKVIAPSSFPSLLNTTGRIILKSHTEKLVDSVAYADTWYKNSLKKPGGWTLEKISLKEKSCNGFYNWAASENSIGGTPGKINSINNNFNTASDLKIQQIVMLNDTIIEVFLNFYSDTSKINQAIFSSQKLGLPKQVVFNKINYRSFKLYYSQPFQEGVPYTILASNLFNCNGFEMNDSQSFTKPFVTPINYPVVINEIFPDPSPSIGLPESEFFELKNLSDSTVSLVNMIYEYGTRKIIFNKGSIQPNGFLIVCADRDTLDYQVYGKTLGLASFPALNNEKGTLVLKNNKGTEFHRLSYDSNGYKDAVKKTGGWTLELIDPLSTCKPSQNYSASVDVTGGTPGRQNSIYLSNKNTTPLSFVSAVLKDSLTVILTFNRGLDSLQATLASHFSINNGAGVPQSAIPIGPSFSTIEIKYNQFLSRNKSYTVTVNGLTDCGSNILNNQTQTFVYPAIAGKNDVLINEILFNPRSDGVDFIEVYNNSDKILDFKNLKIAAVNDKDSVIQIKNISSTQLIFQPQTLWVITSNPDTVKSQYFTTHPNHFIKVASMPSYNDDNGKAVVLNKDNARIDQLNYDKKMHFALLKDLNGVSLERSSFTQPTNTSGNFRSATASVGYATPADKNSQFLENVSAKNEISLASQTFSPDNDGFEDVLRILFNLPQANYVANVTIYNDQGKLIKKLVQNQTLATQGEWIWDGIDQDNNKAKTGIYIIYTELFDLNGNVKKYKKTAVSAAKFE